MSYYIIEGDKLMVSSDLYEKAKIFCSNTPVQIILLQEELKLVCPKKCWVYVSKDQSTYGYGWKYVIMKHEQCHWPNGLGCIEDAPEHWEQQFDRFYNKGGSRPRMIKLMRQIKRKL